jgi:hypothetical protein
MSLKSLPGRVGRVATRLLVVSCLAVPAFAVASEPAGPLTTVDPGNGFTVQLPISADLEPSVLATLRISRFAGRVVGADEDVVQGVRLLREVPLVADPAGGYRLDVSPQAGLPAGTYAALLLVEFVESRVGIRAHAEAHPVYFRIDAAGAASRLGLVAYSDLVDPVVQERNKLGELVPHHRGVLTVSNTRPRGTAVDANIETGAAFVQPGDERNEN